MNSLGPFEILLIFLVILLVFGAKRIPEIARGLGKGIREFKDATTDIKRELNTDAPARPIQPPQGATAARTYDAPQPSQASSEPQAPTQPSERA